MNTIHHCQGPSATTNRLVPIRALLLVYGVLLLIGTRPGIVIRAWTLSSSSSQRQYQECRATVSIRTTRSSGPLYMSSSVPKGSAATPLHKQSIVTMGNGGYLGGILFGYLQRAASIYSTGIGGSSSSRSIRSIGATADTSVRLNRILSQHFVLAFADEASIKLTNLSSGAEPIRERMMGFDAIVLPTNLYVEQKKVAPNTYEVTPNDMAWEIYWDKPKGAYTDFQQSAEALQIKDKIISNFITAAQLAQLKHIFLVVTAATSTTDQDRNENILRQVKASGIPFTCILIPSNLIDRSSQGYTYQDGILDPNIIIESVADITTTTTMTTAAVNDHENAPDTAIYREDVAAICVQAIQSCDWDQPQRYVQVRTTTTTANDGLPSSQEPRRPQRMDQFWCWNSHLLEEQMHRFP